MRARVRQAEVRDEMVHEKGLNPESAAKIGATRRGAAGARRTTLGLTDTPVCRARHCHLQASS